MSGGGSPEDLADLPPEVAALCARLRVFLADEVIPAERAAGVGDAHDAPAELSRRIRLLSAERGFYRLAQPPEMGGGGLGLLAQVALHETIAASGAALGPLVLGGDGGLLRACRGDQRERFLLPVLRGELAAALAFTDHREGPRATAVGRGGRFLLTGVKSFVTGGVEADLLVTVARVVDNDAGPTGTTAFVVRRDAPGLTLRREMRSLDGSTHGEFVLAEVPVPAGDVLGEIGAGLPRALESISAVRLRMAATACGAGRWALEHTLAQVDRPHRSGTPLAERGEVQAMIADSAMDLYAARSAVLAAARRADAAPDPARADVEIAMAKALATESVARIVDRAIQLAGAGAVVDDHPLARLYRRIRVWRIGEGTTEILRLVVARGLLARRRA